jgi:serine/threonine protein kinase/Tol biopolymer transport system component
MPEGLQVDELIAAVADRQAIDWAACLASCRDPDERKLVAQLKVLTEVARAADSSLDRLPQHRQPASQGFAPPFQWGPLEVIEELGRGAFGRVFHARDPRLDRDVALKLFDRAPRGDTTLVREAQLLARIRHPHVVLVHGAESADGRAGLWMELLRGRTLQDVLREQGPFGPHEAALIGLDVCRALAAVHGAGLVHRDIKAANVMRETGGRIVLMDFGAGLQRDEGNRGGGIATGTPLYMAPELFEGADASVSTDLYALGVLLFHIVTGVYPVNGSSLAELRDNHARDARTLLRDARPDIPAALIQVVDRALSRVPEARFRSAADMERALASTLDVHPAVLVVDPTIPRWRRWAEWPLPAALILAAIPIIIAVALIVVRQLERSSPAHDNATMGAPAEPIAFTLKAPEGLDFADGPGLLAVSPDGNRIAFATAGNQISSTIPARLWVRRLGALVAEPIAGTETGNQPFWSPDGRFLAFSASDSSLKRVDVSGGSVVRLADGAVGGTWNRAGVILFGGRDGRVYRIADNGGAPVAVTALAPAHGETRHLWPSFLPDGRRFLFLAYSSPAEGTLYVGSIDSPERTRIANIASKAEYAGGYLFYIRNRALVAHAFDLRTAQLVGEAKSIAHSVRSSGEGRSAFSVSETGVVVYATDTGSDANSLTWFDGNGKRLAAVGEPGTYAYPSLSPDGTRLAVDRLSNGHWDIWLVDLVRNVSTRFTFSNYTERWPVVWSPDATSVVFPARDGESAAFNLYRRSLSGATSDERLFDSADDKEATGFSPDGGLLLFNRELGNGHGTDIWALPMSGDRKPFAVLESRYDEESAVYSPDGRWFAYSSNESGAFQVYAQPFPPTGAKVQVSRDGGSWPRWTLDGKILYSSANRLWSVGVTVAGGLLNAGAPKALFNEPFVGSRFGSFDVDRTGRRFLLVVPEASEPPSVNVLVNPLAELKAAAPAK